MNDVRKNELAGAMFDAFLSAGATEMELEALAKLRDMRMYAHQDPIFIGVFEPEIITYPLHANILGVIRGEMAVNTGEELEKLIDQCTKLRRDNCALERRVNLPRLVEEVFCSEKYREFGSTHKVTRVRNLLVKAKVSTMRQLAMKTEAEMRAFGFGRKLLNEVKETLAGMGLHLGMELENE